MEVCARRLLAPVPCTVDPRVIASVPDRFSFPENEEEILKWWTEQDTFRESVRQSEGRPAYTFYDGPPFANGLPHYGHLLTGFVKDAIPR